jgi:ABC-type lipopolysaccharide export system ATPase subunit
MRETPALVLDGVSRSWPGMPPVFSDLHLQVPRGRVTVLLGPRAAANPHCFAVQPPWIRWMRAGFWWTDCLHSAQHRIGS